MTSRIFAFGAATLAAGLLFLAPSGNAESGTADMAAKLAKAANIDGKDIIAEKPGDWLSYGRNYHEQRFSPLTAINTGNAAKLGAVWEFRTNTVRGLEATPLVSDGVMFVTGSWSKVWALDAKTGKELWAYDPQVPGQWARYACCDVVNRGVALWKGGVFVGTLDGRLVKLDAKTGKPLWQVNTIDKSKPYTITGAPRVVKGLVLIGNGGAEYGVRGYLSAYDADTGKLAWRFYVVPGDPSKPQESKALEKALPTWKASEKFKWWELGGGGTPWDSIVYDPETDLIYLGTGNGSPWNRHMRSPGGGDNLYLSSIVALKPATGDLAWYYQETPGENWDYTATQSLVIADLKIDGKLRKVIMHAPKNGFFYVVDRTNGKLISAKPYTTVTWAKGIDPKTGRPIENPDARYGSSPTTLMPGPIGGHNWQPMAYNPETGLVYIPVIDGTFDFTGQKPLSYEKGAWNTGTDFAAMGRAILASIKAGNPPPPVKGYIRAWNPVTQTMAWQVPMTGAWNSGMLTTAGGLLFAGGSDGIFAAYDAKTGKKLWSEDLKTGIIAPAMTYTVDGQQYVAVAAGWGGSGGLGATGDMETALQKYRTNEGRIFAFKLGGTHQIAALPPVIPRGVPKPPDEKLDSAMVTKGFNLFHRNCAVCHGVLLLSSGEVPDLRAVPPEIWGQYDAIVLDGAMESNGMASFKDILNKNDVAAIRAYVLDEAHKLYKSEHPEAKKAENKK
ncbi:MAG: PQQ-dependent dehydrogenase, methanol/ethanol family [Alphaproteobacteria bacterium]|nr:PQQ-dependent dehydrogenase, methanol/ethanol family [Alphaproteobacteria bacterium]